MGEMKIKISDATEKAFRKLAMQRFGYQKGALSEAAEEAIETWAVSYDEKEEDGSNPIEAISGLLKHVKKGSVELQHGAWNFINKKYLKKRKNADRR